MEVGPSREDPETVVAFVGFQSKEHHDRQQTVGTEQRDHGVSEGADELSRLRRTRS
jgi:hypothetical protein